MKRKAPRRELGALGAGLALVLCAGGAFAAERHVEQVREREALRCGVSANVPGFADLDATGRWSGIEADFCRALAAAVLGNAAAVEFVPLAASMRFPALRLGQIDVLLANTSWTLSREALLGVRFAAALFHDGQGFLVPAASAAKDPADLRGAEICVEKDTTHTARLEDAIAHGKLALNLRKAASPGAAAADFFAGRCAALSAETAQLAALRLRAGVPAADYRILPRTISREVLSVLVRNDDPAWETLVRWTVYGLIIAEESGVDARAAAAGEFPDQVEAFSMTRVEEFAMIASALGVEPGWIIRAVGATGNYAEIFERNLGAASPLALQRGANRLARDGGLLFAPPVR